MSRPNKKDYLMSYKIHNIPSDQNTNNRHDKRELNQILDQWDLFALNYYKNRSNPGTIHTH